MVFACRREELVGTKEFPKLAVELAHFRHDEMGKWEIKWSTATLIARLTALFGDGWLGLPVIVPSINGMMVLGVLEFGSNRLLGFLGGSCVDEALAKCAFDVGDSEPRHIELG